MNLSPRTALAASLLVATAASPLTAQIQLGEEWLLDVGFALDLGVDTLYTDAAVIAPGGGDQVWSFAGVTAHDTVAIRTVPTSEGALADSFPNADFIFRADVGYGIAQPNTDVYMRRRDDDVFIVGIEDPINSPVVPFIRLDNPIAFQSAPVVYEQVGDASTALSRELAGATVAEATGVTLAATFERFRITVEQDVTYRVDAWGTLTLQDEEYETLRIRSVTRTNQVLEAALPGAEYQDVTDLAEESGIVNGLGTDSLIDYSWVVPGLPYPLVQVPLDDTGAPDEARFGLLDTASSSVSYVQPGQRFTLGARVGAQLLQLDLAGGIAGAVGEVIVYDAAGTQVARRSGVALDGGRVEWATGAWPAGVKLATVWVGGTPLATRRFVTQ